MPARFRSLDRNERLAGIGALAVVFSLLLPWYGLPIGGFVKTGLGSFGWVHLALLLTVGAALLLLWECAHGRELPTPLDEGTLLAIAGGWATVLVLYEMFDKPEFRAVGLLRGLGDSPNLRYGIYLALLGAATLCFAGLRKRRADVYLSSVAR